MSLPIDLVDGFTVFLIFSSKGLGQHKRCLLQAMAAAVSVYSQLSENLFLSRTSGTRSAVTRSGALAFVKLPAPLYQTKRKWTMISAKKTSLWAKDCNTKWFFMVHTIHGFIRFTLRNNSSPFIWALLCSSVVGRLGTLGKIARRH